MQILGALAAVASRILEIHNYNVVDALAAYTDAKSASRRQQEISDSLNALFNKYSSGEDVNETDIDGTLLYFSDLGIEPEDICGLILAYLLHSPTTGVFYRHDFTEKWGSLGIDNVTDMHRILNDLKMGLYVGTKPTDLKKLELNFVDLYNFAFGFLKESPAHKWLDYSLAAEYWRFLIPIFWSKWQIINAPTTEFSFFQQRLKQWSTFITTEYKRPISQDAWYMFYNFFRDIICECPLDLKLYSEMDAWPSIVDEYVEYLRLNDLIHI